MPNFLEIVNFLSVALLLMWVLPVFPFLYVVARWRGGVGPASGAGTHAAMMYFATVGLLVALAGGANLTYGMISVTPVEPEMTRVSWGLLTGSLSFCVLNVILLRRLGPLADPSDVARVFVGFLMIMSGTIAMGALIMMMIELFREAESERAIELRTDHILMFASWTFYFLVTYLLTTRLLSRKAS